MSHNKYIFWSNEISDQNWFIGTDVRFLTNLLSRAASKALEDVSLLLWFQHVFAIFSVLLIPTATYWMNAFSVPAGQHHISRWRRDWLFTGRLVQNGDDLGRQKESDN